MTTETMNMHKALVERKILPDRIYKLQRECEFIKAVKNNSKKIGGKTVRELEEAMKANYQKVVDLMKRFDALEDAIIKSNSVTTLTFNGNTMTVAEAINRKNKQVGRLKTWRDIVTVKYRDAMSTYDMNSGDVLEDEANEYVQRILRSQGGTVEKSDEKFIKALHDSYIENNEFVLIDPLGLKDIIASLDEEIAVLESEYDAALSVSNATTVIEFSY